MKYTYLEDLIDENKKDNKLKSDIIHAIYSRARNDISRVTRANDNKNDNEYAIFQWDSLLYNCIHPKLHELMYKVEQATNIAAAIEVRVIRRFNCNNGVETNVFKHVKSPIIWCKQHQILLFNLNDYELCKMFNTKIDEICKLCEEIKGDNHHERNERKIS